MDPWKSIGLGVTKQEISMTFPIDLHERAWDFD
jgi:hypothetical protein